MVVWIVGLSGAGKSVIGRALHARWKAAQPATVLVDGDEIRAIFGNDREERDYTIDGRRENARRIRALCAWLDGQGLDVVCCILSIFEESHAWNREHLSRYFEVYVEAPPELLAERSARDVYRRAARGEIRNVVGVDIPFTPPAHPDLVVHNGAPPPDPQQVAERIVAAIERKFGRA